MLGAGDGKVRSGRDRAPVLLQKAAPGGAPVFQVGAVWGVVRSSPAAGSTGGARRAAPAGLGSA